MKTEFETLRNEINADDLKFSFKDLNFKVDDIVSHCYKLDLNTKQNEYLYKLLDIEAIYRQRKTRVCFI